MVMKGEVSFLKNGEIFKHRLLGRWLERGRGWTIVIDGGAESDLSDTEYR